MHEPHTYFSSHHHKNKFMESWYMRLRPKPLPIGCQMKHYFNSSAYRFCKSKICSFGSLKCFWIALICNGFGDVHRMNAICFLILMVRMRTEKAFKKKGMTVWLVVGCVVELSDWLCENAFLFSQQIYTIYPLYIHFSYSQSQLYNKE